MKSQITLEFTLIVSFVVLVAIVVIILYFEYGYNSARSVSISYPKFVQSIYPINSTHILLTTSEMIPGNTMNLTFLFNTSTGNVIYNINYLLLNVSKTQTGGYAYLLNTINTPEYNPYNEIYRICSVGYIYQNKHIEITNINNC